jgi:hypothetical protein
MISEAVCDFHKFPFYHELMNKNLNPVIVENLVATKEVECLPPDTVVRQAG